MRKHKILHVFNLIYIPVKLDLHRLDSNILINIKIVSI